MAEESESSAAGGSAEVRMALLGQTGSGRSSSGNTILGRSSFWTDMSPLSVTSRCQRSGGVADGRSLWLIDTQGFFHTCLSPDEVRAELSRYVELSAPGPNAFLLDWVSAAYTCGETRGRLPEGEQGIMGVCLEERLQVTELLKKIDLLMERIAGAHYTADMLLQADTAVRHMQQRILGDDQEEEEEARKRAERLFWYELLTAMGRGAVEASGVMEKGKGKGKKVKAVQRVTAIASTPLSIISAAEVMGGAMIEGTKVLYKHFRDL